MPSRRKKPRPASRSIRVEEVGRGCVQDNRDYSRESGFFVIAVEKFFTFRDDWHGDDRARPLVRQYQTTLDSILESHPDLRRCIAYCRDCGIRFLTHPRNAGRRNLRCPFGCRRHHRQQCSSQRSTAYYQTAEGKRKKKRLNARRQCKQVLPILSPDLDRQAPPANEPHSDESSVTVELRLEGVLLDESSLASSPMLPYVRMVVGLIEGVELTCREVLCLLRRSMRQRSFGARRKIDYILGFLHQHPP